MKPIPLKAAIGKNAIRLIRMGCVNRPFFQVGVLPFERRAGLPPNEVIGSFDPMPNERNEKLFSVDLDRLAYWIGEGATVSDAVGTLLSLSGFLPIHHRIYKMAWRNRKETAAAHANSGNNTDDAS